MFTIQSYKLEDTTRVAIVHEPERAMKYIKIVMMEDCPLRVTKIPASERRYMRPLERKGKEYPLKRALKIFKRFAKSYGVTKSAKKFLKEAS